MSSIPGYTLEKYLMWLYDLIVDEDTSANKSLQIAELLGVNTRRTHITLENFKELVQLFENIREDIETLLGNFDEEHMSWRTYAGLFDVITDEKYILGYEYLQKIGTNHK
jgi:glycine cleavage system aminomethyltransferase T